MADARDRTYCNDYGDAPDCLGAVDDRYTMDFSDIGEPPILWCAVCGPRAHAMMGSINASFEASGAAFVDDFRQAVDEALKDRKTH